MAKQELGPNQLKWIEALESGGYEQGIEMLCRNNAYCCLGVGCEVFAIPSVTLSGRRKAYGRRNEPNEAPDELIELLGINGRCGELKLGQLKDEISLTEANDHGATFSEIATFCREHPEAVFIEPR